MKVVERIANAVMDHSRVAIAAMVVLTVVAGIGAPMVSQASSLDQFQTDSAAGDKLDFVEERFERGSGNTTTAQIIVRDGNVLERDALLGILRYERALREDPAVNGTLADENAIVGLPNLLATAAIRAGDARALEARAAALEANRTRLAADRRALGTRSDALNATVAGLEAAMTELRHSPEAPIRPAFEAVAANTTVPLDDEDFGTFRRAVTRLRGAETGAAARDAIELGTTGVLGDELAALESRAGELEQRGAALAERARALQADRASLASAPPPSLSEQIDALAAMNESQVDRVLARVLTEDGSKGGGGPFALMPTGYDPGSTQAGATMLLVTQQTATDAASPVGVSDAVVDAQLAMRDIGQDRGGDLAFLVFGGGIITHEIDASMADSMTIVAPLALLFVLVALAVGYRDLLDILLGVVGIGVVLVWTFGFMGWADIAFNQIFVAVPVLLIGLSIDYAIHIFMRHREERLAENGDGGASDGPRGSMRVALSGVGIALVWVTATTVIGFLSNLTSPVPPIREFGIVSAVGILAALLVFGVLLPALKVELDELLEGYGLDRRKRAIGTGGGRSSRALAVGAVAARKAPYVVIAVALLLTVAGGYGGSQVSTAFDQQDFLAEDPPDWMAELPEPFAPAEYTAKANLQYVNDNFVREDSRTHVLIEGDLANPETLSRLARAQAAAREKSVTSTLSNGEPAIQSPLTVMSSVAATNATFNSTLRAADTDGDGVPDRNLSAVYGTLFDVAPEQAGSYLLGGDGGYTAARIVVGVDGAASGDAKTTQMQAVAEVAAGNGVEATATGQPILNTLVQDQLLETVVQSLAITLVVVFLFLMAAYRLTEGSATLGAVTLMPVALSVAWILGTMYLLEVPFNVMTGMITSLTVGLGVAYSIHLSERYNQELERQRAVWPAMRTAVTGTGGALLGSAATTVGGFGVLVFAILPPLQQFGLITGLTIVYALLASVLVLPSLLVVWTRFAGPAWAREQLLEGDEGAGAGADEGAAGVRVDGEGSPADGPTAARSVDHAYVRPGQDLGVSVSVSATAGRLALRETAEAELVSVTDVEPDPVAVVEHGDTLYVAWDLAEPAPIRVAYDATLAPEAADGDALGFEGRLLTGEGEREVAGDTSVEVVADVFERVTVRGTVTADDLRTAEDHLAAGAISEAQFRRIYRAWLRGGEGLPAADHAAADDD